MAATRTHWSVRCSNTNFCQHGDSRRHFAAKWLLRTRRTHSAANRFHGVRAESGFPLCRTPRRARSQHGVPRPLGVRVRTTGRAQTRDGRVVNSVVRFGGSTGLPCSEERSTTLVVSPTAATELTPTPAHIVAVLHIPPRYDRHGIGAVGAPGRSELIAAARRHNALERSQSDPAPSQRAIGAGSLHR